MNARGALLKRQQKIAANQKAWEQSQAQALADHEAGKPQDWKTAYKNAGGHNTAVWSTVGSTVGGGVLGGGIDASMGNDSWTDGAAVGAGLGAIAGAGGFARSVNRLKVGSMTHVENGGTQVSYKGPHSVHNNTGKYDKKNPVKRTDPKVMSELNTVYNYANGVGR